MWCCLRGVHAHTLWHHGIPAIGLLGATNWRENRDFKCFEGIGTIYIIIEPDNGGHAVLGWLGEVQYVTA